MFCGVPTASASGSICSSLRAQWHEVRTPVPRVATVLPDAVMKKAPGSSVVGHFVVSDDADPERVYERAPRRFDPVPVDIWLIEVPPNPK